jgi:hypothetical protein
MRQISMPPPPRGIRTRNPSKRTAAIPVSELPQSHALNRASTGSSSLLLIYYKILHAYLQQFVNYRKQTKSWRKVQQDENKFYSACNIR